MLYKGYINTYEFTKFKAMCAVVNAVKNVIITMNTANDEQEYLTKK